MSAAAPGASVFRSVLFLSAVMLAVIVPSASMGQGPALDKASLECISCHGSAVSAEDPTLVCHEYGCGHRIGLDYAEASARNRSLAPPGSFPPGVKLVDGRMSCTTCHVPYSKEDHEAQSAERARRALMPRLPDPMLSVDNAGSRLCMACHRK